MAGQDHVGDHRLKGGISLKHDAAAAAADIFGLVFPVREHQLACRSRLGPGEDGIHAAGFRDAAVVDNGDAGADPVSYTHLDVYKRQSTGFAPGGATLEDVKLMKSIVGDEVKVKAAGGIRDLETCLAMIDAGAERIGTSSSIKIINAYKKMLAEEK